MNRSRSGPSFRLLACHMVNYLSLYDEKAPKVFGSLLVGEFRLLPLPEMRHAHRLEIKSVAVVPDGHGLIVAVATAHAVV